jgi:fucose permease
MLAIFAVMNLLSGLSWIVFAPMFELLQQLYGADLLTINYLTFSYCLWFIPMNFPSTYVLDKYGLKVGVMLGFAIQVCGFWVRCFVNKSFWFVLVGQTISAIGQPFTYNAPAKLTSNWFNEN